MNRAISAGLIFFGMLFVAHNQADAADIDIGLRVKEAGVASPTAIAIESEGSPVTGGDCDVEVFDTGGSGGMLWQSASHCIDNNLRAYIRKDPQDNPIAIIPTKLLAQACGLGNWTWTETERRPSWLGGTFTCKVPVGGGTATSPLHIAKSNVVYHVALVSPSDTKASKVLIRLASGETKALKKFS